MAGIEKQMQFDTLRLYLIKIGGRVGGLLTPVKLHLASAYSHQMLWQALGEIVREHYPRTRAL